ncbi:PepSY domain-containing protein [Sulfitobacter faviae]|uniref:PepSY domain-containing protein n=1 Tax=Sulfitobacter faviae TaxID=1775881 RepID=A0ABZ0V0P3_9RHOB|nr:PepSY domain-containing protein [Sulfitobacter faviae]WPZ21583.1 PepSY domain-containing protein [Sulfitobacter faviae]
MTHKFTALATSLLLAPAALFAQETAPEAERISMSQAIKSAQSSIDGGVLEAEIETEGDVLVYEIDLVRGESVYEVTVNAATGDVMKQSEEQLTSFLSGLFQEDELRAAGTARDVLMTALTELEGQDGTWIEEVSLDDEDDRMVYEVELTDATGERELLIDATTGEITPDD